MIHLYCLAVQAGFHSDAAECWPVTQTALDRSPDAALVINFFSPVHSYYKILSKCSRSYFCFPAYSIYLLVIESRVRRNQGNGYL